MMERSMDCKLLAIFFFSLSCSYICTEYMSLNWNSFFCISFLTYHECNFDKE